MDIEKSIISSAGKKKVVSRKSPQAQGEPTLKRPRASSVDKVVEKVKEPSLSPVAFLSFLGISWNRLKSKLTALPPVTSGRCSATSRRRQLSSLLKVRFIASASIHCLYWPRLLPSASIRLNAGLPSRLSLRYQEGSSLTSYIRTSCAK